MTIYKIRVNEAEGRVQLEEATRALCLICASQSMVNKEEIEYIGLMVAHSL